MTLALAGIFISLVFLIVMAYRGHSVVVVAPIAAAIAVLFSGAPQIATYTQIFMPALGKFLTNYFPLFLTGAIFGHLMTISGLAQKLAKGISALFGPKQAMLSTVIATALLTYGGVSAWVVVFTIMPIAMELFREADIPRRLMPGTVAFGTITFALAALPGSPQIHNAIPTKYFGTNTYAAPLFGIISALLMFVLGILWLNYRVRSLNKAGVGFATDSSNVDSHREETAAQVLATEAGLAGGSAAGATPQDIFQGDHSAGKRSVAVDGFLGLIPILVVVAVNFSYVYGFSRWLNFDYLAEEKFGATNIQAVLGTWSVTLALITAIIVIILMHPKDIKKHLSELSEGAKTGVLPAFTTASEVGYGAVIASLAVFAVLRDGVFGVSDNPLIVGVLSTGVISGITGSSSGGLSITMQAFGEQLAQMATDSGMNVELLHRVIAMASVSFDSLPHNGAVLTMLLVCGMTHRQSYKDIAVLTVAVPLVALAIMLAVHGVFPALV